MKFSLTQTGPLPRGSCLCSTWTLPGVDIEDHWAKGMRAVGLWPQPSADAVRFLAVLMPEIALTNNGKLILPADHAAARCGSARMLATELVRCGLLRWGTFMHREDSVLLSGRPYPA